MRIDELLSEGRVPGWGPELNPIPSSGGDKVVMFKNRRLIITADWLDKKPKRPPDFSLGAWNFSQDGGAQKPCWVTGPGSAVCDLSN